MRIEWGWVQVRRGWGWVQVRMGVGLDAGED